MAVNEGTDMDRDAISLRQRPAWASRVRAIQGVVQHGRKLGRQLGFPTANVALEPGGEPTYGVYAALTRLPDGRIFPGVASIGVRPTVGGVEPLLEVWMFGFDEDIYGKTIRTELVKFLRGEEKFDSLEILTRQVMADAQEARRVLGMTTDGAEQGVALRVAFQER
jgi:riboflavin kinase/FMN adenylyltransferase